MSQTYNVAIIDDDKISLDSLVELLGCYPELSIIGTAKTPNSGKKLILEKRPDLLFLDVELPGMTGLELLNQMHESITWEMKVVFYTAYDKYLLQAIRESAFDFLLKPIVKEELQIIMNRYFCSMISQKDMPSFSDSVAALLPNQHTFAITTITGYQILRLEQIGYFEHRKEDKQWSVVLCNQSRLQLKRNTCADQIVKYSSTFVQISQQVIININYLAMIRGKYCVLYPPFENETELIISRIFFRELQERFNFI